MHLGQLHKGYILMRKQCIMFMLLLTASMAVTQELYLNEKPMPHVYVIVSCKSYILMRKQCLMFMLLLAASTAVTQELYLDEKTMPHVYVIVSHIYGGYTRVIS